MAVVLPLRGAEGDDEDVEDVGWNASTVALSWEFETLVYPLLCWLVDDDDDKDAGRDPPPVASATHDESKSEPNEFLLATTSTIGAQVPVSWSLLYW